MRTDLILVKRGLLLAPISKEDNNDSAFYAIKLLNTFGILVDKPQLVTKEHVRLISEVFGETVPASFYENPQHLVHYTTSELLLEQLVSYFRIEWVDGIFSEDPETFERMELFKKALPNFEEGKEFTFRNYQIIDASEVVNKLAEIGKDLATYTRPWSEDETYTFDTIFKMGLISKDVKLGSKDNIFHMFLGTVDPYFAKQLDQKDIVKISVDLIGEQKELEYTPEQVHLLDIGVKNCYPTKLTKKQAKFFRQLTNKIGKRVNVDNKRSPYRLAKQHIDAGRPVDAAKVFAENGSMLERNLVWVLSRAKIDEVRPIIDLIEVTNPIVATQLLNGLITPASGNRVFTYYNKGRAVSYTETDEEKKNRKSILSPAIREEVADILNDKIDGYYADLPKIGKVFIDEEFFNIPMIFNTSAYGSGIGVVPTGTRIPFTNKYVRAFTHWEDIHDVDMSMLFIKEDLKTQDSVGFWNYSSKPLGNDALHSGDNRSQRGTEYLDLDIEAIARRGYRYGVLGVNAWGTASFLKGKTFTGLQLKDDLNTKAWDPKNMFFKTQVSGDTSNYMSFGIDFVEKTLIMLNFKNLSSARALESKDIMEAVKIMDSKSLSRFNIGKLATLRAEVVVDNPEDADIVFSATHLPLEDQIVYKPTDIEKLVALINKTE